MTTRCQRGAAPAPKRSRISNPGELSCAPEPCRTTSENEFCGESALTERREDDWPAVGIEIG